MYVLTPRALASMSVAAVACGYAFLRGRTPERVGAASYGGAWALTPAVQLYPLSRFQWGVLGVDVAAAAVLLALALRSDRWWPLLAAALSLLIVVEHFGYAAAPHGLAWAYFAGEEIWGYALLLVFVLGAALEAPRRSLTSATSPG
ncbi:MAG: hypothetical protein INR64_05520 [Caulobacteraceae bacterium]|nr:hypothetical protein [Caulobacter sp.]